MNVACRRLFRALLFLLAVTALGCLETPAPEKQATDPYVSVWAQLNPDVFESENSPGSLLGEFREVAKVRDDQAALNSWQQFLKEFNPQDGYYEDGMHARFVEWAKMEVVRLQHRANGDGEAEQAQIEVMRKKAEFE